MNKVGLQTTYTNVEAQSGREKTIVTESLKESNKREQFKQAKHSNDHDK